MNFITSLKNSRLGFREKFSNSYIKQLLRLGKILIKSPVSSFKNGVLKVMIGLTNDCQCKCEYCCVGLYSKDKENELSSTEIKSVINDINRIPSVFTLLSFFGGEPLLRKDIFALVRYATNSGLFTEIETNGILLSLDSVIRLRDLGLHHVFIRLENSDPILHDKISHFQGCFRSAVTGIKYCVKKKLSCSISTIATKEKIYNGQIKEIIQLGRRLGVKSVRILYPTLAGNWLEANNQMLSEEEKNKVRSLLRPDFVYLESTHICAKELERVCPSKQKKFFYISCYGEVQPCPFVSFSFGNIRNKKINEILGKMWKYFIYSDTNYNNCLMNNPRLYKKHISRVGSSSRFPIDVDIE